MSARLTGAQVELAGYYARRLRSGESLTDGERAELATFFAGVCEAAAEPAREDPAAVRARVQRHRARKRAEQAGTGEGVTVGNGRNGGNGVTAVTTVTAPPTRALGASSATQRRNGAPVTVGNGGNAFPPAPPSSPSPSRPGPHSPSPPLAPSPPGETPSGAAGVALVVPTPDGRLARGAAALPVPVIVERVGLALAAARERGARRLTAAQRRGMLAELVFAYWAQELGHPTALLDEKRQRRIEARLGENGDNGHELLYAVDGARKDDFLMGRTERSREKHDGIQTLFRDREQVERLANLCGPWRRGDAHPVLADLEASAGAPSPALEVLSP